MTGSSVRNIGLTRFFNFNASQFHRPCVCTSIKVSSKSTASKLMPFWTSAWAIRCARISSMQSHLAQMYNNQKQTNRESDTQLYTLCRCHSCDRTAILCMGFELPRKGHIHYFLIPLSTTKTKSKKQTEE